jgi:hypothetical protein
MKSLHVKALLAATVLGGLSAQAQIEIKITGSTAFRSQTFNAIKLLYGANLAFQNPDATADRSSAGKVTFVGTIPALYGTQTVTIKTAYSGSVEGVINLVNGPSAGFVQPTYLTINANGTPGPDDTNTAADFALCDVFQDTTDYNTGAGYDSLDDTKVGIVAFAWNKSVASGMSGVSNLTHQQAQAFLGAGSLPMSILTGNAADADKTIYLAGRNKVSGTRLATQADTGYGALADSTLYKLANNLPAIDSVGFSSGGGLATLLTTANVTNFISYLGIGDSKSVSSTLANALTFNGVPFTAENVRNGAYSFWSYEHLFSRPSLVANNSSKLVLVKGNSNADPIKSNGLANAIDAFIAGQGANATSVQASTMKVIRNSDGGPITKL